MAVYFIGTSALVKRYAHEAGSSLLLTLTELSSRNEVYIAGITRVEVIAALKGRERRGDIASSDANYAIRQFRIHCNGQYRIVDLSATIVHHAMNIAESRVVKGYDAVQIASAKAINHQLHLEGLPALKFVCSDKQMIRACEEEDLEVLNPETDSH